MPAAASSSASKRTLVDSDSDGEYQENVAPPKKRAAPQKRAALSKDTPAQKKVKEVHTEFTLALKTHDDLVQLVLAQQAQLQAIETAASEEKQKVDKSKAEQVVKQVAVQEQKMYRAISASMTWKATCKEGRAKWSYDLPVTFEAFKLIFKLDAKFKKTGKISVKQFGEACGGDTPTHSVRYDTLGVTGDTVNVRYNPDVGSGTVSGTYGVQRGW